MPYIRIPGNKFTMKRNNVPIWIFLILLAYTFYLHSNYTRVLEQEEQKEEAVEKHEYKPELSGKKVLTFGTGGIGGVYFPAGGIIAENINSEENGLKLRIVSTQGSSYNIKAVASGKLDIALTQASTLFAAVNGLGEWKELNPQRNIRMICNLYAESLTMVAAEDSKIESLQDIKGKVVSIGETGSGTLRTVEQLLQSSAMKNIYSTVHTVNLPTNIAISQLQLGKIDAFFFSSGHPARIITLATMGKRKVRFVPITGVESFISSKPYYTDSYISKDVYPYAANTEDILSIGDPVVIITSVGEDSELIGKFTKSIFSNIRKLRDAHPALKSLNTENMLGTVIAPFHGGALKYLTNSGLVPEDIGYAPLKLFVLGAGRVGSLSHLVGGAMVKFVNESKEKHSVRMVIECSDGGTENINGVISGMYHFGIASCFDLVNAYSETEDWTGSIGKKNLRAVLDLYQETVLLLARDGDSVKSLENLSGKTVCLGEKGSSVSRVAKYILQKQLGRNLKNVKLCYQADDKLGSVLSNDQIDCFFFSVNHFSPNILSPDFENVYSMVHETLPGGKFISLPVPQGFGAYNFTPQELVYNADRFYSFSFPVILFSSINTECPIVASVVGILKNSASFINHEYPRLAGYKFTNDISSHTLPLHSGVIDCGGASNTPIKYPSPVTSVSVGVTNINHASYQVGGALCRLLEDYLDAENKDIAAEPIADSKQNIEKVIKGDIDFAIIPSTDCYKAFNGLGRWRNNPQKDLRAICSLYDVPLTIICASDIDPENDNYKIPENLSDIEGLRVSEAIPPEYGYRGNSISLFNMRKFTKSLDELYAINPEEDDISAALDMFQKRKIEAIFCSEPHPSNIVTEAISGPRKGIFIPVTGWHNYITENPCYSVSSIPLDFYRLNQERSNVGTIAVPLILVTSVNQNKEKCSKVIACIYDNYKHLKNYYSSLSGMTDKSLSHGLTIALDSVAEDYINMIKDEYIEENTAKVSQLTLGTGTINGVFYPVGSSIEKIFNRRNLDSSIRLSVESTEGSISNVQAVSSRALDFGLVETTTLYSAISGEELWKDNPQRNLRSICRLHMGYLMLIASEESGIKTFRDLVGKRVNISNPGSGTRGNIEDFYRLDGMEWMKKINALELNVNQAVEAFLKGEIDAFFFNVGLESKIIYRAIGGKTKARFVPITDVDNLFKNNKGYVAAKIPYKNFPKILNTEDVETVGTPTILVTSLPAVADGKEDPVYMLTKEIFENIEELKQSQDALKGLEKHYMSRNLVAPMHKGALKYFREAKLVK